MRRQRVIIFIISALCLAGAAKGTNLGPEDVGNMLQAMQNMKKLWQAFNDAGDWNLYDRLIPGMPHDARYPSPQWNPPRQPMQPWVPGPHNSFGQTNLNGIWQGHDGNILVIDGNRFRIHASEDQYLFGIFMTYGNRFIAYSPQSDITRQYQFEINGELLALQDEHGQIMVFQRLKQDMPAYGASRY